MIHYSTRFFVRLAFKMLKNYLKKSLTPYLYRLGFSHNGIKPPGYLSKEDLDYRKKGFNSLREYFQTKWKLDVDSLCRHYVTCFFKPYLTGRETVLEIGTGVGFMTHAMLEAFPNLQYYSAELDPILCAQLEAEFSQYAFQSIPCEGNHLSTLNNHQVDVVITYGVFTYLSYSTLVQYLYEVKRVLKPDGYFFFDLFDTDKSCANFMDMFLQYSHMGDNRPFLSGAFFEKILNYMGFKQIDQLQEPEREDKNLFSNKFLYQKILTND